MSEPAEEDRDLLALLPEEAANHRWYCCSTHYRDWEQQIARPHLEARGYTVGDFWTSDGDSFGPLVRAVDLTKDGKTEEWFYG